MAWPPVLPPLGRTNDTPTKDAHPSDHNVTAQALADLVAKVQANTDAITAAATVVPWITLAPTAPWVVVVNHQPLQYRKVGDMVQVRGDVQNGANGSVIAVLPVGYRPPATIDVPVSNWSGGPVVVMIQLTTNGNIGYFGANTPSETGLSFQFSVTP